MWAKFYMILANKSTKPRAQCKSYPNTHSLRVCNSFFYHPSCSDNLIGCDWSLGLHTLIACNVFVSLFHWQLFDMQVLYLWLHHIHALPPDTEELCSVSFHARRVFFFFLGVASCSETWKCVKHKIPAVNTYLPTVLKSSIYKTPGFKWNVHQDIWQWDRFNIPHRDPRQFQN